MVQEYKLFIGGEFKASSTGETFEDINPATLESLATIQVAGTEDVDRAVEAAEAGFRLWSEIPAAKRAEILFRAARILQERKEELAVLMTEEMGKVLPETRGDVQEAIDITNYAAGEGRRMLGETTTSELKEKFCMKIVKFLSRDHIYNNMEYKNNDMLEKDSFALIIFITAIAMAVSLLGIIICIKVTHLY